MSEDRGCDGVVDELIKIGSFGQLMVAALLEVVEDWGVIYFFYGVGFDERVKDGKALLDIDGDLIAKQIDTSDLNLFSWFGKVHVVAYHYYFFGAWDTAGNYFWGALLND